MTLSDQAYPLFRPRGVPREYLGRTKVPREYLGSTRDPIGQPRGVPREDSGSSGVPVVRVNRPGFARSA